ncbi:transcriptional regulator, GntR family [Roseovarius lutimaris]|uniref:Transcriptional regulator, GntR family n=2 Tax=Roseovarius lutimaris TaxID=1005928 RepID=A0A1I5ERY1_9RHOB|nr:transcriptional regulator, GntR family [Roseovarius lutimaris]
MVYHKSVGFAPLLGKLEKTMKLRPIVTNFTLKDHVYERLREAITAVDIYSADADLRLDERTLADQLKVSRTPLRDAIARLEAEGLVSVVPRKGVFLLRKSLDEILEMIVAWAALESMAARMATVHASDAEIASLRKIASKHNDKLSLTRISEYSDDNIKFHLRILEVSHCSLLKTMAEALFLHMRAVRLRAMGEADRINRSVVDHAEIIEALEARDADDAAEKVREHTMRLHEHVRKTWTRLELAQKTNVETALGA